MSKGAVAAIMVAIVGGGGVAAYVLTRPPKRQGKVLNPATPGTVPVQRPALPLMRSYEIRPQFAGAVRTLPSG